MIPNSPIVWDILFCWLGIVASYFFLLSTIKSNVYNGFCIMIDRNKFKHFNFWIASDEKSISFELGAWIWCVDIYSYVLRRKKIKTKWHEQCFNHLLQSYKVRFIVNIRHQQLFFIAWNDHYVNYVEYYMNRGNFYGCRFVSTINPSASFILID